MTKFYASRQSAMIAAKNACKKIHGKAFEASEGFDFEIWSEIPWGECRKKFRFRLKA